MGGRVAGWLGRQVDDPAASTAGGRLAAILHMLCGVLVGAATLLPLAEGASRAPLLFVSVSAMAVGGALWLLPWDRWHPRASLFVVSTTALSLIVAHNLATGFDGFRYGLFFLVLFAWIGLAHAPGTALKTAPALAAAYAIPMLRDEAMLARSGALSSIAYAVPIGVLIGETIAAVAGRLRASEAARRAGEARWRSLVINASDLILVLGRDGIVQYSSPAVERLFGYTEDAVEGLQVLDLIHPDDLGFVLGRLAQTLGRPGVGEHIEFRVRRADGVYTWVESIGTNLLGEANVGGIVCNVHDISERKESERVLVHRARHDSLTGLPNRLELLERVSAHLGADQPPFALLLLDLDRFKEINDALGHETGDRVLIEVANRLAEVARPGSVVARLGGDEFAAIVADVATVADAGIAAMELRSALDQPFEFDGMALHIGASVGIALCDEHLQRSGPDVTVLLQRADVAMYRAKSAGIGWGAFGEEDEENRPARLAMVGDLRAALDSGEIRAVFQPQIRLTTGHVVQVEVLARWTRDGIAVPPDVFIPLAEHTGLIGRLTIAMLRQALAQCRRWSDVGMPLSVAVNISAPSLRHADFVATVRAELAAAGVEPRWLTLEITEGALADGTEAAVAIMHQLRDLGVRLSIDDFGSGYSSMAYLKRLPIDELKIDKAFILDMLTDPRDQPITRAIIELAHSLDLTVVGEGVESPALEELLRRFGCDSAQGFGLCRPVGAEEATAWLGDRVAPVTAPRRLRTIGAIGA